MGKWSIRQLLLDATMGRIDGDMETASESVAKSFSLYGRVNTYFPSDREHKYEVYQNPYTTTISELGCVCVCAWK